MDEISQETYARPLAGVSILTRRRASMTRTTPTCHRYRVCRLMLGAAWIAGGLALAPPGAGAQQTAPATIEWQLPVAPTHPPQTKAQDEEGMEHGRAPPA